MSAELAVHVQLDPLCPVLFWTWVLASAAWCCSAASRAPPSCSARAPATCPAVLPATLFPHPPVALPKHLLLAQPCSAGAQLWPAASASWLCSWARSLPNAPQLRPAVLSSFYNSASVPIAVAGGPSLAVLFEVFGLLYWSSNCLAVTFQIPISL